MGVFCQGIIHDDILIDVTEEEVPELTSNRVESVWLVLVEMICRQGGPFVGHDISGKVARLSNRWVLHWFNYSNVEGLCVLCIKARL